MENTEAKTRLSIRQHRDLADDLLARADEADPNRDISPARNLSEAISLDVLDPAKLRWTAREYQWSANVMQDCLDELEGLRKLRRPIS